MKKKYFFNFLLFFFLLLSSHSMGGVGGRAACLPVGRVSPTDFNEHRGFPVRVNEDVPDILDFDRRQSVARRFELSPFGGDFFGDKMSHSFIVGGNLKINLTESLGVSGSFGYSKAIMDSTSDIGKSFTNNNVYLMDGALVYSVPAAFINRKGGVTEADFFTSLGAGIVKTNGTDHVGGFIGGGLKVRPNLSWLAIRVEIRNTFTSIDNPSGSNFENDLSVRIGPTFLLPPEF